MLAKIDPAHWDVLLGRLADSLDDDGGIGLEDDAVVDDLVNCEGHEVVVLNDGPFVYGLPGRISTVAARDLARSLLE